MRTQISLVMALFVALVMQGCGSDDGAADAAASATADAGAKDGPVDVPIAGDAAAPDATVANDGAAQAGVDAAGEGKGAADAAAGDTKGGSDAAATLGTLTPKQLNDALATKDFLLIDVRTVCPTRIAGLDACLSTNTDEVAAFIGPDLDRRVVLVCQSGTRSTAVGNALIKLGYRNISQLKGGMSAWIEAGYPTNSDGGI